MSAGIFRQSLITVADLITGDLAAALMRQLRLVAGVELSVGIAEKRPIDERIARLDEARAALTDSLEALDELRADAEAARAEYASVVKSLQTALSNKDDAEQKLESIRIIIAQDVNAFQAVAGVSDIRKERLIGFGSGVAASIVASAIWTWGPQLMQFTNRL